ncbi:membrane protein [Rubrivivax pictus]|uniref:Membrane protein n=2 Tax=Pseudaquabacterium pictum TaxID=2315236 RepID=A0A480AWE1_9BURK|nr:membrane protein [Rubrivivax pictus]
MPDTMRHPQPFLPTRAARRPAALPLALVLLAVLAACSPGADAPKGGGGGGGGGMPPATVGVVTVQPAEVPLVTELPGRLEAWRTAQVRARVPGIVAKRLFTEGSEVKAGQPLYQLDDAAYRATVASAEAAVARADAAVAQAQAQVQRNQPLAEAKAISAQEWLQTQTTLKTAQADAATARAALQTARINLDYAAIKAPIAGRIGRALVTEGALVGQGDATQMALIQQTGTLYVNFTQSAAEVLRLRKALEAGQLQRAAGSRAAEVQVVLDDGSLYPLPGKLLFSDPAVDAATGQVSLRAELPNPQGLLLPGLFVKVRIVQATSAQAIKLPQQAVTRGASGDTVLVVGADNKPAPRPVKVSGSQGSDWVITSGLAAGDRVIVDGVQKMMPGAPVNPVPWSPPGKPGAAPAGAASGASAPAAAAPAASTAASR